MVPLAAQLVNIHFYLCQFPKSRVHLAVAGFPLPPRALACMKHIGAQVLRCGYANVLFSLHRLAQLPHLNWLRAWLLFSHR